MENISYEISGACEELFNRIWDKTTIHSTYSLATLLCNKMRWPISDDVWEEVHLKAMERIKKELTDGKQYLRNIE
jgi:hypothetical protein